MPIPYFRGTGRGKHLWKIRREGYRALLIASRWHLKGGYTEKRIRGVWVMQTIARTEDDHYVCCFLRRDDFWAESTRRARETEALERRSSFALVVATAPQRLAQDRREQDS
jgi:hypothetical protein